jgi:hypothetical protein
VTYFDAVVTIRRVAELLEWAGLPTFCLGCLLMVSIVRSAPPAVEPEADEAAPAVA